MKQTGPLIIDLPGTVLSKREKAWVSHPVVAGIILFKHNFESKSQLHELIAEIRKLRNDLFICVDHEGGRVQRFKSGFTEIPPMASLGVAYNKDPNGALEQAREYGGVIAKELSEVGIDFSFAPVLDIDYGRSNVIGHRAFHPEPEVVARLAGALVDGLHQHGMIACGKHFPGHGYVEHDSHVADPVDTRNLNEIMDTDILPYTKLSHHLDAVMTAHIKFPDIDDEIVSYSKIWLKDILREKMGYEGIIISDDLAMHAAGSANPIQKIKRALDAGCDLVPYCQNYLATEAIMEHASELEPYMNAHAARLHVKQGVSYGNVENLL